MEERGSPIERLARQVFQTYHSSLCSAPIGGGGGGGVGGARTYSGPALFYLSPAGGWRRDGLLRFRQRSEIGKRQAQIPMHTMP